MPISMKITPLKLRRLQKELKQSDVAKAIGVEKSLVDKAISKLAKEDKVEYLYLGASFVKLKGK